MKLEPVYVLSPQSSPKAIPRQRALMAIACAAMMGMLGGILGGIAIAGSGALATDPMHQWLGELADDTSPLEELLYNHSIFLSRLEREYPGDPGLWHGFERIARAVLLNAELPDRRIIASSLVHTINSNAAPFGSDPGAIESKLAAIAR